MGGEPQLVGPRKTFPAGKAKVKSGCRTCKIRKVKCDEGRPACQRCVTTGRTCDGYGVWGGGGNAHGNHSIDRKDCNLVPRHALPMFASEVSTEERGCFDWFKNRTAVKLPGAFLSTFWDTLVLQASLNEPAVLHAVLALGSIHRSRVVGGNNPGSIENVQNEKEQFVLRQCSKAFSHLQAHFSIGNGTSVRITLMACIMFICLEFLNGHYQTAQTHLRHGFKLLRQIQANSSDVADNVLVLRPSSELIDDWITEIFTRLYVVVALFNQGFMHPNLVLQSSGPELSVHIFKSSNEARQCMDRIFCEIFLLSEQDRQQKESGSMGPSPQLLDHKRCIRDGLRSWLQAYEASRTIFEAQMPLRSVVSGKLLLSFHTMATIMMDACLEPSSEMIFDSHIHDFVSIVMHSIGLWKIVASTSLHQTVFGCRYGLDMSSSITDMGWIPPLYFTALKCRNHRIRLQATRLLHVSMHREAIWDAEISACVAQKVMETEERNFYNGISIPGDFPLDSFPDERDLSLQSLPEAYRIHDVQVELPDDHMGKVVLSYKQRLGNDSWELRMSEYDLPNQRWIDRVEEASGNVKDAPLTPWQHLIATRASVGEIL